MTANGAVNMSVEPMARWESPEEDTQVNVSVLEERLRFPYASNVVASNRMMKSAMSEQV
ncbi:unnamed protein product [Gongylonema pulchrum]|uniref:Uncharacterized protein n=1 Tax=Gongylonema pulchrum TaxID=637853 RepID=A0A183ENG3_9BILA|nr:unnamed protein product [Gongylonema pulchrum]